MKTKNPFATAVEWCPICQDRPAPCSICADFTQPLPTLKAVGPRRVVVGVWIGAAVTVALVLWWGVLVVVN